MSLSPRVSPLFQILETSLKPFRVREEPGPELTFPASVLRDLLQILRSEEVPPVAC